MSNTFEIGCIDCEEVYWFGQTSKGLPYIYSEEKILEFLLEHIGHKLVVVDAYSDCDSWSEIFKNGKGCK